MFVLWVASYVLSLAPAAYIAGRYPETETILSVVYAPVIYLLPEPVPLGNRYVAFVLWCGHRGGQDREASLR